MAANWNWCCGRLLLLGGDTACGATLSVGFIMRCFVYQPPYQDNSWLPVFPIPGMLCMPVHIHLSTYSQETSLPTRSLTKHFPRTHTPFSLHPTIGLHTYKPLKAWP